MPARSSLVLLVAFTLTLLAGTAAGQAAAGPSNDLQMPGYRPEGMSMWDAWHIEHEGKAYMFHLQRLASKSKRLPAEEDTLGQAVSEDLINWVELPLGLPPGPSGALDDMQPYTGSVVAHKGLFYLYYTMRAKADDGARQRTGLATSQDLQNWQRHTGNPIIEPDSRWYVSTPSAVVDCRDLVVIADPGKGGWLGFYAARAPATELGNGGVIAAVRSRDLIHWEHLPPAFAPGKYACIEVPDVFEINGKWYLTALTGHEYGNRGYFSDPNVTRGTIYAVADRPEGPYREFRDDNVVIGGDQHTSYSCRTFVFKGERHLFAIQGNPGGPATLSPPLRLRTDRKGHLRAAWSPRSQGLRLRTIADSKVLPPDPSFVPSHYRWTMPAGSWKRNGGTYAGDSSSGWQIASLNIPSRRVEIGLTLRLKQGVAAGIVWGNMSGGWGKDTVFLLDAEAQTVRAATTPMFGESMTRRFPVKHDQDYVLRIVIRPPRFEMYIDDILVLQSALAISDSNIEQAKVGLFVDRGRAEIRDLVVYELGFKK